jgi:putative glutathione S-transferase
MLDPTLVSTKVLEDHGVASAFSTLDPSKHTCKTLRHLYEICGGYMSAGVRATTPMLFDSKGDCIVNNESMELAKYLNTWGGAVGPDLYPEALQTEIDAKVDWIYPINNGVYRCGFASSQKAYDAAADELEKRMKEVDEFMAQRKFLVGEQLTIADIRLFNTLIRMDEVYVIYFKCYFASLRIANGTSKFPNLLRFIAHLYNEFPEIRESVCMDDIRNHYFTSHAIRNMFAIVPKEIGVLRELEAMRSNM